MTKKKKQRKIFVLDTSVILYDHNAITNFEENDIAIPITVLEELDNFKKGNDTRNFEARSFIRWLDEIASESLLTDWINLNGPTKGKFKVVMDTKGGELDANLAFGERKNDHKILNATMAVAKENPKAKVTLVSKDICLRVKAKSLDLLAEDYETGKIKEIDQLYSGKTEKSKINATVIDKLFEENRVEASELKIKDPQANHFYILKSGKKSVLSYFNPKEQLIERVDKTLAFKIKPKNAEQTFAMHALLNPDIKLVTLRGIAGTGKTLLAIACALEQRRSYQQIYVTRPIIPLSNKDIGYLPGDVKSKLDPYMQPIWDNLKYIKSNLGNDPNAKRIDEMVENEKIAIAPLAYIRGRTLANVYFIVDEAQNLTPHEVKTIISRAGENTKIVFTGDIFQIDTPYLDAQSNGLSYLIDKVKNHPLFAHVTLEKGERSDLANLANELL